MNKNKHLILDDRKNIQLMLDNKESFASIAAALARILPRFQRKYGIISSTNGGGGLHLPYNSCSKRFTCQSRISVLSAMLPENTPCADVAPCATPYAGILNRSSVISF